MTQLAGLVVGPVRGDAHAGGLRFKLKDISGDSRKTVAVLYSAGARSLQGRAPHRRRRCAEERHVRRAARLDDHEMPVEGDAPKQSGDSA